MCDLLLIFLLRIQRSMLNTKHASYNYTHRPVCTLNTDSIRIVSARTGFTPNKCKRDEKSVTDNYETPNKKLILLFIAKGQIIK